MFITFLAFPYILISSNTKISASATELVGTIQTQNYFKLYRVEVGTILNMYRSF